MCETERRMQELKEEILKQIEGEEDVEEERILEIIDERILREGKEVYMSLHMKQQMRKELFNSIRKLDLLQELLDDDTVTEIMVNGTEGIFIERQGRIRRWEKQFTRTKDLERLVQQIAAGCNRIVNEAVPIVDARLKGGARVNIVLYLSLIHI